MSQSRIHNTLRNSFVGLGSYALTSILTFISRAVFIRTLGVEYLGISGLYTNILSVLALSDLGVQTVMVYSLYKPIAQGDTERIAALIRYYRKLYLVVAAAIAVLGVACVPLLRFLVKDSGLPQNELILYYLLILANSVCSYLAISKSTLIRADQNMNIIQGVYAITNAGMHFVQILLLIFFRNYTLFLVIPILFTLLNNIVLTRIADKKYPYLKTTYGDNSVGRGIQKDITSNLKATFLYKLGATIITSTDNILISVILGTVVVGYYNNYFTVVALVNAILGIVVNSVLASIGNFNATQSSESKFRLFRLMLLVFYVIAGFCAACYLAIFDDFIGWWLGKEFILDDVFLVSLVVNSTIVCISNPLWMTREASGVFKAVRYVMLAAAVINIVLSILLAQFMGLAGIILATAIARLVTLFWYEPRMLCKSVFQTPVSAYWKVVAKLFLAMIPCAVVGWLLHGFATTNILFIAVKVILCGLITLFSFLLLFGRSEEMKKIFGIARKFLRK